MEGRVASPVPSVCRRECKIASGLRRRWSIEVAKAASGALSTHAWPPGPVPGAASRYRRRPAAAAARRPARCCHRRRFRPRAAPPQPLPPRAGTAPATVADPGRVPPRPLLPRRRRFRPRAARPALGVVTAPATGAVSWTAAAAPAPRRSARRRRAWAVIAEASRLAGFRGCGYEVVCCFHLRL
jgi:hypothetical protein